MVARTLEGLVTGVQSLLMYELLPIFQAPTYTPSSVLLLEDSQKPTASP